MSNEFYCKFIKPDLSLDLFVENIGMFHNPTDESKEVVVMPDGRVDLFFIRSGPDDPFEVFLIGLETAPEQRSIAPGTMAFVISFRPLSVEYILQTSISDVLNTARTLPNDFWNLKTDDLKDLETFVKRVSEIITELIPETVDERKRKLFDLMYISNGEMSVKELSEQTGWSSRQINRYFNQQFGLSLKAYSNILRFRASLEHIVEGKLFPELNFTDQTHFIKEIKKFSGVVPKELSKNKNDRFILLSVLKQK
ncbi:helix-turn-helix domain-containing protein [Chryseobacterium vrystaatense]|uniref:Helix-turn-helix domain-containing protein n=1 Tax=Chryseobacterium vrystaatense TaxID=307480 RepID=A0A1M5NJ84_9FLAO|nr:AraC family transcriptional regulator [Chryseobacterium vrystaatense]SHG89644.1 Helix-turn-helix domain-containing protein [Chryseobacterium vrystaatense]